MRDVWPQGCKKTPEADKVEELLRNPSYVAQQKIDGIRCVLHIDSEGIAHYTTRGASLEDPTKPIEITHRLSHMRLPGGLSKLAGTELDGEIWAPGYTSAEISGQVSFRSTVPVDSRLKLNVFDVTAVKGSPIEDCTLSQRLFWLNKLEVALNGKLPFLHFVPTAETEEEKRALLATEFEAGREGIVLKNLDATYQMGTYKRDAKPSNNWYKVKKKDTLDVKITGSLPPDKFYRDPTTGVYDLGRYTKPYAQGWFGSICFSFEQDGVVYEGSTSGMTDRVREEMSDGDHGILSSFIGRVMEVEYMEKTADGNLRHPRFIRLRGEEEKSEN